MATILDGQGLSEEILKKLADEVRSLRAAGQNVRLGIVLIGKNKASRAYVARKKEWGEKIGIAVDIFSDQEIPGLEVYKHIPGEALESPENLRNYLSQLTAEENLQGIIVQLPIPKHVREASDGANKTQKILNAIPKDIDVDLLTTASRRDLSNNVSPILPPTIVGILKLLERHSIEIFRKNVLFVGKGPLVGEPGMIIFRNKGARVKYIDESTNKATYDRRLKEADIIISAVGKPGLIRGDMLSDGQVIIDAGYGENKGDVDFDTVAPKASHITPVPGGVGPMTVAMLLWNLVYLTKQKIAS